MKLSLFSLIKMVMIVLALTQSLSLSVNGPIARAEQPSEGQKKALLIGNQNYEIRDMNLENPLNDVRALEKTLQDIGFSVSRYEDVDKQTLREAVNTFVATLNEGDVALVYYSGHGMEIKGENIFLPTNFKAKTEPDALDDGYRVQTMLDQLAEIPKTNNIILLDACRNNPYVRSWDRTGVEGRGFKSISTTEGSFYIAFSTEPGKPAKDGKDLGNSPFVLGLLKHIHTPGQDIESMMQKVRKDVLHLTANEQRPYATSGLLDPLVLVPTSIDSTTPTPLTNSTPVVPVALPSPSTSMEGFIDIRKGTFKMGSSRTNETLHEVTLTHNFFLMESEVTQEDYARLMKSNPSKFSDNLENPVEKVTWFDALEYANNLSIQQGLEPCYIINADQTAVTINAKSESVYDCKGYRLPTEAEWEYAYRTGKSSDFHNGAMTKEKGNDPQLTKIAWYDNNASKTTHPVKSLAHNDWLIFDMSGNVMEWVWDSHQNYKKDSQTDPEISNFSANSKRVARGGSWIDSAVNCRASARTSFKPQSKFDSLGFRLAITKH